MVTNRLFALTPNTVVTPCPRCQNNTVFIGCSLRVAENCSEVYVTCKCSYDPTEQDSDFRFEHAQGLLDDNNLAIALSCWNDAIADIATRPARS